MPPRLNIDVHLPVRTILTFLGAVLIVGAVLKMWPVLVFLTISVLLAVALDPLVSWMSGRRPSRTMSVALLAVALFVAFAAVAAFILPPLAQQLADLARDLPGLQQRVESRLPPGNQLARALIGQMFSLPMSPEFVAELNKPLMWGRMALETLTTGLVVLVSTLYLLLDGKKLYAWLLAYVPRVHRDKMRQTLPEVSQVVYSYVRGQFITSLLFSGAVAMALTVMQVPAVLPLALLAGLCDIIPVVGIIMATLPATALALTVSPGTAAAVFGFYAVYHLIETYLVVPRVYGNSLRLSTLAVLLALIVGATLQGILGAVLVLPFVAAYPIIERIWLKTYLADEVLADHDALARDAETGGTGAVDAVLQGEQHPAELHEEQARDHTAQDAELQELIAQQTRDR